jgi:hypothetical protein
MESMEHPGTDHERHRGRPAAWYRAAGLVGPLALLLFFSFALGYLLLFRHAIIDDAYIALDYARSLLRAGTWGINPGHPSNSATSPLNVLLLTLASLVLGETPDVTVWLAALCYAVTGLALDRISRRLFETPAFGWIATVALLFNPLLVSTLGLESVLFATVLVLMLYCYLASRWRWLGIAAGMLSITRPEGVLFALVVVPFLPGSRARLRYVAAFVLSSMPWYLFSWLYLGSLVPDTVFIKSAMSSYAASNYFNGMLLYLLKYPSETALSLAFVPLLALFALKPVRTTPVLQYLIAVLIVHFAGYSALHVPPFHWYYAPDIAIAILFGSLSLGGLYRRSQSGTAARAAIRRVATVYAVLPLVSMLVLLARLGFKVNEMPIMTNWGTAAQYEQVGRWLEDHIAGKTVVLQGEIGTIAYYAPDCYVLDVFSDRRWLIEAVNVELSREGMLAALYRANFAFLRNGPDYPPAAFLLKGYGDREQQDTPHIMDWDTSTKWGPNGMVVLRAY